jgi:hypothetical protein
MPDPLKPIRRVVTGHDERGRSVVAIDGPAPNTNAPSMGSGRRYTDLWVWEQAPLSLTDTSDGGNIAYDFPGPPVGGHLRVVQAHTVPPDFNKAKDSESIALHEPRLRPSGRMWDRGGDNAFTSPMHKTE